jgi:peptidoglycan biosynthesis protein MviN/MurJ (putative lipid II flippase)
VNAALHVWLVRVMGYQGLAFGTSLAALFNAATLLYLLRAQLGGLHVARLLSSVTRITVAAAVMGIAAVAANNSMQAWLPGDAVVLQAVRLAAAIGLAVAVLAGCAWVLRIREFKESVSLVMRRIRRTR